MDRGKELLTNGTSRGSEIGDSNRISFNYLSTWVACIVTTKLRKHDILQNSRLLKLENILTRDIFMQLIDKPRKSNFSLQDSLYPLYVDRDSNKGLVALDRTAYQDFEVLFYKYIHHVHDYDPSKGITLLQPLIFKQFAVEPTELREKDLAPSQKFPSIKIKKSEISQNLKLKNREFSKQNQRQIVRMEMTTRRNITGYPFTPSMTLKNRLDMMDFVETICNKFKGGMNG